MYSVIILILSWRCKIRCGATDRVRSTVHLTNTYTLSQQRFDSSTSQFRSTFSPTGLPLSSTIVSVKTNRAWLPMEIEKNTEGNEFRKTDLFAS